MQPVMMPGEAVFNVIDNTDRQFGTPSPSAASRTACGTINSISSVVRHTVGIIMMPSATPPANAEKCPRNGRKLTCGLTISAYAASPITIEGTPFSTSAVNRIAFASVVPRPNSARKIPPPIPIGMPIKLANPSSTPEPTMEFAIPPPFSPSGFGIWVKKARFSELAPLISKYPKITTSGVTTRIVANTASAVTAWSVNARIFDFKLSSYTNLSSMRLRRRAARHRPHQQLRQRIHNNRHDEQRQSDLNQRGAMHVAHCLGKLVGDHRSHRAAIRQQRLVNLRRIADHHRDRHRLAQRAPQPKNDAAHNADPRITQNAHADHLPARRAQRQHRLALRVRHRRHHLARQRRDNRQNHDRENYAAGKKSQPRRVVVGEETGPAQRVRQHWVHILAQ